MLNLKPTSLISLLLMTAISAAAQSANDRYPFVKNGKVGFIDAEEGVVGRH
jgi:hypothetical protein